MVTRVEERVIDGPAGALLAVGFALHTPVVGGAVIGVRIVPVPLGALEVGTASLGVDGTPPAITSTATDTTAIVRLRLVIC